MDLPIEINILNQNFDNIVKQCYKFSSSLLTSIKSFSLDNGLNWNINYVNSSAFCIHLYDKNYIIVDVIPQHNAFCHKEDFKITTFVESLTDNRNICNLLEYHTPQNWSNLENVIIEIIRVMSIVSENFNTDLVYYKLKKLKHKIIENVFELNYRYDDKANLVKKEFIDLNNIENPPWDFDVGFYLNST